MKKGAGPTKLTTKPIPSATLPIHGLTRDGREKVIDENSGRSKYISRRIGTALNEQGGLTHKRW